MKTTELIRILSESLEYRGDMEVCGVANGNLFEDFELYADAATLFVELYK